MKKYIFGIVCVLLLVLIYIISRPPRFKEVYAARFKPGYSMNVQWVDDRYVLTTSSSQVLLWDVLEGRQVLTYTSTEFEHFNVSILSTSTTNHIVMLGDGRFYVWNLFEADPFFLWTIPRGVPCDPMMYEKSFTTHETGVEVLIGCWNQNRDSQTVYSIGTATTEVITYFDQTWKAVDPYLEHTVFGFDEKTTSIYAMNLHTQRLIWNTSIDDQRYVNFESINEASLLACSEFESICYLLDRQAGRLQQTFQFDHMVEYAYLINEELVTLHRVAGNLIGIEVRSIRTGIQLRYIRIELVSSSNSYAIIANLSVHGHLAVSFFQEGDSGIELLWSPVYVYDVATLDRIATLDAHTDAVTHLAFDPTGTYLFTGSYDKTFKVWEIGK